MYCPRLDHFVRFNSDGTVSRCGHMIDAPRFHNLESMEASQWLQDVKNQFQQGQWPVECQRCKEIEQESVSSIRLHAIALDQTETYPNYLQVGGVLDNLCNAACLTCAPDCSTRIGSLSGRVFPIVDNTNRFWKLPQDRIRHLDINGGEPSYSKNYRQLLKNLPPNLKTLRLNTNCSVVLEELQHVVEQGVEVTITVSCDGIGPVFELVRWPIRWDVFYQNLMRYRSMPVRLNLWTTVSVLNIDDLANIQAFAQAHGIDHGYAYLKSPIELAVDTQDQASSKTYIQKQKQLRGIT
jgi:hypothetical protein